MIRIILGNVGSGKTAFMVREMASAQNKRKTYSNIKTRIKHQIDINAGMIIKRDIVDYKKSRKSGEQEPVYKNKLNVEYWKSIKEPINVVLDEAHTILNARRSMSSINIVISDWLALIRRVLGSAESGYGELVFITQLHNRIDVIARDMATNIIYTVCHYLKSCKKCGISFREHSEMPESMEKCRRCGNNYMKKHSHMLEVWHFPSMDNYISWKEFGSKSFYKHYYIRDIEEYFHLYDTLQWDNMFSEFYN